MAIPKEIQEKIRNLAREKKWDELVNFLKEQLEEERVTVQDIFHCVKTLTWKHPQDYAMAASMINRIGFIVSNLKNPKTRKFAPQFYKLAADRNHNSGARNYAFCLLNGRYGIEKSPSQALIYAQKAVELGQAPLHKLFLYECLQKNHRVMEASDGLISFLSALSFNSKSPAQDVREQAIKLCDEMLDIFFQALDFEDDIDPLTEETCRSYLGRLQAFLSISTLPADFEIIRQKASFLKGQLHEYLEEYPAAMQSYCIVTDKNPVFFQKAMAASANLLKKQASILLEPDNEESDTTEESGKESEKAEESDKESEKAEESDKESEKAEESDKESEKAEESDKESEKAEESDGELRPKEIQDKTLTLPNEVHLPTDFRKFWVKEATWFYSVNEEGLREETKTRKTQLKQLLDAQKLKLTLELEAVSSALSLNKKDKQLSSKKKELEHTLENLAQERTELLKALSDRVALYLPENRSNIRAHRTEQKFFDFRRSKKKKSLFNLTQQIIDHRVREPKLSPEPIDLSNTSSRLFITAEKLWQETINPYNKPQGRYAILPLPTARKASWGGGSSSGSNDYAPKESYKIENTTVSSEHRINPKKQRLGDSFLPDLSHYAAIRSSLIDIAGGRTGIEEAKKIARLMIRYGQHQQSITSEELQDLYSDTETLSRKGIIKYTDLFNQICFLVMVKEQAQWLSATDPQYQLGMAVAQARCLIMMEAGFITLQEAFDSGALFGVYTGSKLADNAEALARPCRAINELYLVYLQSKHSFEYMNFFKKNLHAKDKKSSIQNTLVLTREQAHLDLKYVYGGESDTDDEEYTSDLDKDHDLQESMGKCSL